MYVLKSNGNKQIKTVNYMTKMERCQTISIDHKPITIENTCASSRYCSTTGDNPYLNLKTRLIITYSQSQEKQILKLLENTQRGDLKPSQLLQTSELWYGSRGVGNWTGVKQSPGLKSETKKLTLKGTSSSSSWTYYIRFGFK